MIELLSPEQQLQAKSKLSQLIARVSSDKALNAYAILEPPQSESVNEICMKTDIVYDEVLAEVLPEFEDVGGSLNDIFKFTKERLSDFY